MIHHDDAHDDMSSVLRRSKNLFIGIGRLVENHRDSSVKQSGIHTRYMNTSLDRLNRCQAPVEQLDY